VKVYDNTPEKHATMLLMTQLLRVIHNKIMSFCKTNILL